MASAARLGSSRRDRSSGKSQADVDPAVKSKNVPGDSYFSLDEVLDLGGTKVSLNLFVGPTLMKARLKAHGFPS